MAFSTHSILATHANKLDFNGDGLTDLPWRGQDGSTVAWIMPADGRSIADHLWANPIDRGAALRGVGDVEHNGTSDLIWQNAANETRVGVSLNGQVRDVYAGTTGAAIEAVGDFNGDGHADLLVHFTDGWMAVSAEARKIPPIGLGKIAPFSDDYQLTGTGDFNGDGHTDMLFRGTGEHAGTMLLEVPVSVYDRFNTLETAPITIADPGPAWNILGLGDFNGDSKADILWQHDSLTRTIWFGDGGNFTSSAPLVDPGPDWSVASIGDFNNDGRSDLMWRSASQPGLHSEWLMDGERIAGYGGTFNVGSDFWSLG